MVIMWRHFVEIRKRLSPSLFWMVIVSPILIAQDATVGRGIYADCAKSVFVL